MTELTWIQIIIPILTAVAGYFLRYYFDRIRDAEARRFEDKREHYRNLLLGLKSLREGNTEHLDLIWYEYSFLWLHAPDPVIQSANRLFREMRDEEKPSKEIAGLIGDLLIHIRRDMGFARTGLRSSDFQGKLDE